MATAATLHATPAHNLSTRDQAPQTSSTPAPNSYIPSGPVETTLSFYRPPADGAAPYNYVEEPPAGQPRNNYGVEEARITIDDARGQESSFSTDKHGFALLRVGPSAETSFTDEASIKEKYYPEVEQLLKDELGAKKVFIFDHTIRRAAKDAKRGPVNRVHIDQTPASAAERVRHHLPEEADALLAGRYRIVNVWRPLNGPVVKNPLAFAVSDSVPADAVVPVEHRYPTRTGQTAGIRNTQGQKWYYLSGMENDERILLQCADSLTGKRVAHTAFSDERTAGEDWKGRESIEVRTLVFN